MDKRKESYQLKTFVANRIATIQEMTSSEQWRYVATEDNPADFVSRGMDSLKLKTCFICRFVYNCKSQESKRIGPLDLGELKKAEQLLLKLVQKEEFKVELNGIQNSAMVPSNSRVKTLNPFIDNEGILRVGGRLRNSDINYNHKFPILFFAFET
ncbi:integrase catalytic domain-containing protein [Trichonephila clavipes]|nr:integrase catalytic domain-containing protein [Trichonephila clavipes]